MEFTLPRNLKEVISIKTVVILVIASYTFITPVLVFAEGLSLLDSLYLITVTLTSATYGDITVTHGVSRFFVALLPFVSYLIMIILVLILLTTVRFIEEPSDDPSGSI